MKTSPLRVKHTICRERQPLCVVENLPSEGAEMRPDAMRALAAALIAAASDCEAMRLPKSGGAVRQEYPR